MLINIKHVNFTALSTTKNTFEQKTSSLWTLSSYEYCKVLRTAFLWNNSRSSRWQMLFKIGVLKSFQTSQESTCVADLQWLLLGKDIGKFRQGSSVDFKFRESHWNRFNRDQVLWWVLYYFILTTKKAHVHVSLIIREYSQKESPWGVV